MRLLDIAKKYECRPAVQNIKSPLKWIPLSKSIILVRRILLNGDKHYLFFIHVPTLFKTRGRYVLIKENDYENLVLLKQMVGYEFVNFEVSDYGKITKTESIPYINLEGKPDYMISMYDMDNSKKVEINDLLDLLDLLVILDGSIHMNPLKEVNDNSFELGSITDYRRKVYEFVSSSDKPTLSYRYLLKGTTKDVITGESVPSNRYFHYPLLTNTGAIKVNELEVTVPLSEQNIHYVNEYISPYIVKGSVGKYKDSELYFIVDTKLLKPISTLHEMRNSYGLVYGKEKSRLMLKSLSTFKNLVKNLSIKAGTPIQELNMYEYGVLENKIKTVDLVLRDKYSIQESIDASIKIEALLKGVNLNTTYLQNLIEGYADEKIDDDFIQKHIKMVDGAWKQGVIYIDAVKILFSCIKGTSYKDMFEIAKKTYNELEILYNSYKIRLHVWQYTEDESLTFVAKMLSSTPYSRDITNQSHLMFTFKIETLGEVKTFDIVLKQEISKH